MFSSEPDTLFDDDDKYYYIVVIGSASGLGQNIFFCLSPSPIFSHKKCVLLFSILNDDYLRLISVVCAFIFFLQSQISNIMELFHIKFH